ncbi:MAG: hypothetical protein CM15mP85_24800 [Rhodobacterales bacterium]|nr:MAG: hypothetical protein CM15mP85_24800 [Rhodobacterales bacterium]
MPGFALAKKTAEVYDQDPSVEGLSCWVMDIFLFWGDS